jgi:two-component system response regulator RegA
VYPGNVASSSLHAFERVLIVEDNAALRAAIARLARGWGAKVYEAGTLREAKALMATRPDLFIADVRLPDGPIFAALEEAAEAWPKPLIVAMSGQASAEEAFRLAQIGVRSYVAKPLTLAGLEEAIEEAVADPPSFDVAVSAHVGREPMRDVQARLRNVMLRQALARSEGSRTGAARLLKISRQAVQQILRGRSRAAGESPLASAEALASTEKGKREGIPDPRAEPK